MPAPNLDSLGAFKWATHAGPKLPVTSTCTQVYTYLSNTKEASAVPREFQTLAHLIVLLNPSMGSSPSKASSSFLHICPDQPSLDHPIKESCSGHRFREKKGGSDVTFQINSKAPTSQKEFGGSVNFLREITLSTITMSQLCCSQRK